MWNSGSRMQTRSSWAAFPGVVRGKHGGPWCISFCLSSFSWFLNFQVLSSCPSQWSPKTSSQHCLVVIPESLGHGRITAVRCSATACCTHGPPLQPSLKWVHCGFIHYWKNPEYWLWPSTVLGAGSISEYPYISPQASHCRVSWVFCVCF